MPEIKGGKFLEAYLRKMSAKVTNPATLKVGFLENATYPDGASVAMVAAIQNFGAPSQGIPPRPFFSKMVGDKSPGWTASLANILPRTQYDGKTALALLGEGIKGQLRRAIVDMNDPPLAKATASRKGFDKPLIDTSNMINSIDSEIE